MGMVFRTCCRGECWQQRRYRSARERLRRFHAGCWHARSLSENNQESVAVGDLNGDGIEDLVIANEGANTLTVLLGNGSGGFTPAAGSPFAAGS